jgi:hypothetical protein
VRRTPLASHNAQRIVLSGRRRLDAVVAPTSGDEVVRRPGDGTDILSGELGGSGAWR